MTTPSPSYAWQHSSEQNFSWILKTKIAKDFIEYVDPITLNVLLVSRKVALTEEEESKLKGKNGRRIKNEYLLSVLYKKDDWFLKLLKALKDPAIDQGWLADKFKKTAEKLINDVDSTTDDCDSENPDFRDTLRRLTRKKGNPSRGQSQDHIVGQGQDEIDGRVSPRQDQGHRSIQSQGQGRPSMSKASQHSRSTEYRQSAPSMYSSIAPKDRERDENEYDTVNDPYDSILLYDDFELAEEDLYDDARTPHLSAKKSDQHISDTVIKPYHNESYYNLTPKTVSTAPSSASTSSARDPRSRGNDHVVNNTQPRDAANNSSMPAVYGSLIPGNWSLPEAKDSYETLGASGKYSSETCRGSDASYTGHSQRSKPDDRYSRPVGESNGGRHCTLSKSETNIPSSKIVSQMSDITLDDQHAAKKSGRRFEDDPGKNFTRQEVDKELSSFPGYIPDITENEVGGRLRRCEDGTYVLWYYTEQLAPALSVMHSGKTVTFLMKKRVGHDGLTFFIYKDQMKAFSMKELVTHHLTSGIRDQHRLIISLQTPLTYI